METVKELQSKIDFLKNKIIIIENNICKKNEDMFNSECKQLLEGKSDTIKSSIKGIDHIYIDKYPHHPSFCINVAITSPIGCLVNNNYLFKDMLYDIYFEETKDFKDEIDY